MHERMVGDVLHEHCFPNPVRTEKNGVLAVVDESEAEQLLDRLSVNVGWPGPIESIDGFEGTNPGVAQSTVQTPTLALGLFDIQKSPLFGLISPTVESLFDPKTFPRVACPAIAADGTRATDVHVRCLERSSKPFIAAPCEP